MLYLTYDTRHRYLSCYTWHLIPDTGTSMLYLTLDTRHRYLPCYIWYPTPVLTMLYLTHTRHRCLPCYTWHMIPKTGACHAILNTWYPTPVLAMLYLTLDIRHRCLICHTWHLILTPSIWHAFMWYKYIDLTSWPLIRHYHAWHLYYMAYSWLSLLRDLAWLLYCYQIFGTPELLYSWISVSPVLMSHVLLLFLIAQSDWRPTKHAWSRDDEDVSHNRASVRRFLNGTKCHTEQNATPHTWWGPPFESVGATSRIHSPHRVKCHTTHVVGATSWICGATSCINPQSKVPQGVKCHTTHVVWATSWICRATSSLLPVLPGIRVISILSAY